MLTDFDWTPLETSHLAVLQLPEATRCQSFLFSTYES